MLGNISLMTLGRSKWGIPARSNFWWIFPVAYRIYTRARPAKNQICRGGHRPCSTTNRRYQPSQIKSAEIKKLLISYRKSSRGDRRRSPPTSTISPRSSTNHHGLNRHMATFRPTRIGRNSRAKRNELIDRVENHKNQIRKHLYDLAITSGAFNTSLDAV